MGFKGKKITDVGNYQNIFDIFKDFFGKNAILKFVSLVLAIILIVWFSSHITAGLKYVFKGISKGTLKTVSTALGSELKKDEFGNINFMILGYGGKQHAGGFLSDTMMIASFNPKVGAVTMLSIPRDFYIKRENGYFSKINTFFTSHYGQSGDVDLAARETMKKLNEITGVQPEYYLLVDFNGFESLIDSMGGLDIDVKENLLDSMYPTAAGGYETFKVNSGRNHFDGATALKYARSRHSTSDFSRAGRQQQIIKGIIEKMLSASVLTNVAKIKDLYKNYTKMVSTNLTLGEIFSLAQYAYDVKGFSSFVYTTECSDKGYQLVKPGCLLYTPDTAAFGGASVSIPQGATATKIDYYKKIQNFAFLVIHNQKYLLENAKLNILNGIDKEAAKKLYGPQNYIANDLAVLLRKYAFNIYDVGNSDIKTDKTIVYLNGTGDYSGTLEILKLFVDYDEVKQNVGGTGEDITLVLGLKYLEDQKKKISDEF